MSDNSNNPSLSEGIFPEGYKQGFEKAQKLKWQPWHKPRKFWLRQNQWNKEIEKLIDGLRLANRPFVYFGLPGDDLIDFRFIVEVCKQKDVTVKLVGFNNCENKENSQLQSDVNKNEVFMNDSVIADSDIHTDQFQTISDLNSVAFKFADEKGPYDVINLDLCGSFSGIGKQESCYQATFNLLKTQVSNRAEPWIFLITTRADKQKVNLADVGNFWKNIDKNIKQSSGFKTELEKNYLSEDISNINDPADFVKKLSSPGFEKMFGVFLSKWLLSLMTSNKTWTVSLLDSYWYRTNSAGSRPPNMLSLAFQFQPNPIEIQDPTGLAQPQNLQQKTTPQVPETQQALEILKKMDGLIDLDQHLSDTPKEFHEFIKQSATSLQEAGYDTNDYEDWAKDMIPDIFKKSAAGDN
jgi:hypothetical protein